MNLLILTQYFYPENFRINDLAFEMQKRGHSVSILTGLPNYPGGKLEKGYSFRPYIEMINGVNVIRSPLVPRGSNNKLMLALNYISFPIFASMMSLFFINKKIDHIFIYGASPIFLAIPSIFLKFITRAPVTLWIQDLWPESLSASRMVKSNTLIKLVGKITTLIYYFMDRILITSPGFIESVRKYDKSQTPIDYLPQWGEEIFENKILCKQINVYKHMPRNSFKVLFAGNIGFAQNLEILIKAAEILKKHDITFVILGEGRDRIRLRKIIEDKKLSNVLFPGSFDISTMPNFFEAADALFLSLMDDSVLSLTVPGKIQAYMAMGKPILTAINGAASQVVEDAEAGFSCPPEREDLLAENILKVFNMDLAQKSKIKESALNYYHKNYSRKVSIDRIERILQGS